MFRAAVLLLIGLKAVLQSAADSNAGEAPRTEKFLGPLPAASSWEASGEKRKENSGLIGAHSWIKMEFGLAPEGRLAHAATGLGNDKVLIFGGVDKQRDLLNDSWVLTMDADDVTGLWSPLRTDGAGPEPRYAHTIVTLRDGRIVMFGGITGENRSDETWVLCMDENNTGATWKSVTITGDRPVGRGLHSAVPLHDGRMIIFGGAAAEKQPLDDVWALALEPETNSGTWAQINTIGGPPQSRAGHSAVAMHAGGHMAVFGGLTLSGEKIVALNDTWMLFVDIGATTGTWTALQTPGGAPAHRGLHSAAMWPSGRMSIFGGFSLDTSNRTLDDTWTLSLEGDVSGTWRPMDTTSAPPSARAWHSMSLLGTKLVVFGGFGGWNADSQPFNDTWVLL